MRLVLSMLILFIPAVATTQVLWINEFHYDNSGEDIDQFIEVLADDRYADIHLYLYNGINGTVYDSVSLDTLSWTATGGDLFTIIWRMEDLQNGSPDGIALIAGDSVLETLAYEGTFTASEGMAEGTEFPDIGIRQDGTSPPGLTIQRTGYGSRVEHFQWSMANQSQDQMNDGQIITFEPLIISEVKAVQFDETPLFDHSQPQVIEFYAVNIHEPVTVHIPPGFEVATSPDFTDVYSFSRPLILPVISDWIPPSVLYIRFCPIEPTDYSATLFLDQPEAGIYPIDLYGREGLPEQPRAWINEFHYDNVGVDTLEFVEIAVRYPERYTLGGLTLYLYNGTNGEPYHIAPFSEAWAGERQDDVYQLFVFEISGIQNGPSDGIGLAYNERPLHFISYEGTFSAISGPFAGRETEAILPVEEGTTPINSSIQLIGEGSSKNDFHWVLISGANTMGRINMEQILPVLLLTSQYEGTHLSWHVAAESDLFGYVIRGHTADNSDSLHFVQARNEPLISIDYAINVDPAWYSYISVSYITYDGREEQLFRIAVMPPGTIQKPQIISDRNSFCLQLPGPWLLAPIHATLYATDGRMLAELYDKPETSRFCLGHWLGDIPTGSYYLRLQNPEENLILRFKRP